MNTKINSYINFAVRANKVLWGIDMVKASKTKPCCILFDKTLGDNSRKQMLRYSEMNDIKCFELDENYLNNLLKRNNVKLIGIIDDSLGNAIIQQMS